MKISGILLAAGCSARMGGRDKLLLYYRGKTLLERAVELLDALPLFEKIAVTSREISLPPGIKPVVNTSPGEGLSSSVRLGTAAASGDYYLFLNADQPRLAAGDILPLTAARKPGSIIYPEINGKPSSPVLFSACYREELLSLTGNTGGRVIRARRPEYCVAVPVENPGAFADIDSEESYNDLINGKRT